MIFDAERLQTLGSGASAGDEWWRSAVIYQVYPRSFADSNGDGIGDLPGITARLGYLADLGIDAVWLSPFFTSPQNDAGYDVADYRGIDPLFGDAEDFDQLVEEAHRRSMKVIIDLVPNHTSSQHPWFQEALAAGPGSAQRARYLFREGRGAHGELPPNNWQSVFHGPAWSRIEEADGTPGQWYLHLFDSTQPDLDWQNSEVREEFRGILRFWAARGVDGFRVDVARGLVKDPALPDYPEHLQMISGEAPDGTRPPFWDQDGVQEIYEDWNEVLSGLGGERALVAEAYVQPPARLARYVRRGRMQQAFNFEYMTAPFTAVDQLSVIRRSLEAYDAVAAPSTWVLNNHDNVRHVSRLGLDGDVPTGDGLGPEGPQPDLVVGDRKARAASLLMLSLPGSAYVYQGEELGLPEVTDLPRDRRQDPTWFRSGGTIVGRDGCRVPLPWDAEAPAFGFNATGASWLPQPESFGRYAASAQRGDKTSMLELYRSAISLRRRFHLGTGQVVLVDRTAEDVLELRNGELTVIVNFGDHEVAAPERGELLIASSPSAASSVAPWTTAWYR